MRIQTFTNGTKRILNDYDLDVAASLLRRLIKRCFSKPNH